MSFDNGWISVAEVDKLPPLHEKCQVLVVKPDGVRLVSMDERSQSGRWRFWGDISGGGWIVAHQPLAAMPTPTPAKPPLVARMVSRLDWSAAPAAIARQAIGIIDEERAKDAPFGKDDMRNLRKCYARALAYNPADEIASLLLAIQRLEGET